MKSQNPFDEEIGSALAPDKRLALWKLRSARFRFQHRWNVIRALLGRQVTWHSAWLGLKYPDQVTWLLRTPPGNGQMAVCPAVIAELEHMDRAMSESITDKASATEGMSVQHSLYSREDELRHCKICGGAEGSLPTQCPGRRMTDSEEQAVHIGFLDFADGAWVVKDRNGHQLAYATTNACAEQAAASLAFTGVGATSQRPERSAETCKLGPDSFAETCKLEPKTSAETCNLGLPKPALYIQRTSFQSTTTTQSRKGHGDDLAEPVFCEATWRAKCKALADEANFGCGLVYEVFELTLGARVDAELVHVAEIHRARAIEIAVEHGYTTPEERAATEQMLRDDGCCIHGLDPYNCPVGCGDIDSGDDELDEIDLRPCEVCGDPLVAHDSPSACEFVASDATPEPQKDDGSIKNV